MGLLSSVDKSAVRWLFSFCISLGSCNLFTLSVQSVSPFQTSVLHFFFFFFFAPEIGPDMSLGISSVHPACLRQFFKFGIALFLPHNKMCSMNLWKKENCVPRKLKNAGSKSTRRELRAVCEMIAMHNREVRQICNTTLHSGFSELAKYQASF